MRLCRPPPPRSDPDSRTWGFFAVAEWIEDSALAGAPLASYAATQQETYRDPQTGPTVPNAMGQKRKCQTLHSFRFSDISRFCFVLFIWIPLELGPHKPQHGSFVYFSFYSSSTPHVFTLTICFICWSRRFSCCSLRIK